MTSSKNSQLELDSKRLQLKKLTVEQIEQIDKILASVGEYGEVHLIVQRGDLKYVNKVESRKVWEDEECD